MIKLKKQYYHFRELQKLAEEGKVKIGRFKSLDTYGTSGCGLVVRAGILVHTESESKKYQIKFSPKGYGTVTDDIVWFNGRRLVKYDKYFKDVDLWLKLNELEGLSRWKRILK